MRRGMTLFPSASQLSTVGDERIPTIIGRCSPNQRPATINHEPKNAATYPTPSSAMTAAAQPRPCRLWRCHWAWSLRSRRAVKSGIPIARSEGKSWCFQLADDKPREESQRRPAPPVQTRCVPQALQYSGDYAGQGLLVLPAHQLAVAEADSAGLGLDRLALGRLLTGPE